MQKTSTGQFASNIVVTVKRNVMIAGSRQRVQIDLLHPQLIAQQPSPQRRNHQMHIHTAGDQALDESPGIQRALAPVMAVTMSIIVKIVSETPIYRFTPTYP